MPYFAQIEIARGVSAPAQTLAGRVFHLALTWRRRARDRKVLTQLDDRMLHDIGLTRADIDREIAKPFWQI